MGILVSLAEYRQKLRQEEQAKMQQELDHLKMLVEAWIAHIGEAEVKPHFLPLDVHLIETIKITAAVVAPPAQININLLVEDTENP